MLRVLLFTITNIAVVALLLAVLTILGVDFRGVTGELILCAVIGFSGALISLFLSKWMAKRSMGVHVIEQPRNQTEQWLLTTVGELAGRAGIDMPEVGIFDAPESNAFATGWNRNKALVAVSTGLLSRFREDEARAVLAHEIGHVANGDMVTLTLIQGVVNTFVIFIARLVANIAANAFAGNRDGESQGGMYQLVFFAVSMVAQLLLAYPASMIVMAFSRWREYRADAAGGNLAGNGAMIRALERLKAEQQAGAEVHMPDSMRAFGIAGGFSKLLSSHPPLDERIAALRNAA